MWTSPLTDLDRDRARATALQLAAALAPRNAHVSTPWAAAQRALLFREFARATGDTAAAGGFAASAAHCLARAVELCGEVAMERRFLGGFLGVAWVVETLEPTSLAAAGGDDDANSEIDDAVATLLERPPTRSMAYLDLVSGLVGTGVYALARPPCDRVERSLERIVYRLEEMAFYLDDGTTWWGYAALSRAGGAFGHNLGVAHGVPGIVAFLAKALARGVAPRRTRALLDGAVAWLLAQQLPAASVARYATVVTDRGPDGPARAAWCYGDPGVSLALLAAARATGDARWEASALEVARHAARRAPATSGVHEATVCHGAAGLLQVFNRLFQATGEDLFRDAARYWFGETLRLHRAGRDDAAPDDGAPPDDRASDVLEGRAGVALALLAAATDGTVPRWDAMLLADVPAGPIDRRAVQCAGNASAAARPCVGACLEVRA